MKYLLLILFFLLVGCNTSDIVASNSQTKILSCTQSNGDIKTYEVEQVLDCSGAEVLYPNINELQCYSLHEFGTFQGYCEIY